MYCQALNAEFHEYLSGGSAVLGRDTWKNDGINTEIC